MIKRSIQIPINDFFLEGFLTLPLNTKGLVIFAHGAGSSRYSPRNTYVAEVLQKEGLCTLLFDLLTEKEDAIYETRFDIKLLTQRLEKVTLWVKSQQEFGHFKIGYFGSSTGAAALNAAVEFGEKISSIVSRGGRPDLATSLEEVKSPTLLIVGEKDLEVIKLNKIAYEQIVAKKELKIVKKATHLFEKPGTLEEVAHLASKWFKKYLL